ncbi:MAG: YitT family protein, partial [Clostridia bacterium]|nr:YitT family protein [Clostridia bacterium]
MKLRNQKPADGAKQEKIKTPLTAAEKKKIAIEQVKKYLIITFGCLIYSVGISLFIEPAELSSGGMTGISIIVNHYVPQVSQGIWLLI